MFVSRLESSKVDQWFPVSVLRSPVGCRIITRALNMRVTSPKVAFL